MVNSRLDLFTAPILMGPLLPKLRGYFAEFLNNISLAHLRILSSPTCVGLRYGPHMFSLRSFSRRREINHFSTLFDPLHRSDFEVHFTSLCSFLLGPTLPSAGLVYPSVSLLHSIEHTRVQESPPVIHRLRLSASP